MGYMKRLLHKMELLILTFNYHRKNHLASVNEDIHIVLKTLVCISTLLKLSFSNYFCIISVFKFEFLQYFTLQLSVMIVWRIWNFKMPHALFILTFHHQRSSTANVWPALKKRLFLSLKR